MNYAIKVMKNGQEDYLRDMLTKTISRFPTHRSAERQIEVMARVSAVKPPGTIVPYPKDKEPK